jgi:hypothetical protein
VTVDTDRPKRRLSITLRAMLELVLVVGLGLGWPIARARQQRISVDAVRALNGVVMYDWQDDIDSTPESLGPKVPKWLRRLFGDDLFQRADFVVLDSGYTDAAALPHLRRMPGLRTVWLTGDLASDDSLVYLRGLDSLEELQLLDHQGLTDRGLARVAGLKSLEVLNIDPPKAGWPAISDEGLRHLEALKRLERLIVGGAHLTDRGGGRLKVLPRLKELDIEGCSGVTDEGVRSLQESRPGLKVVK